MTDVLMDPELDSKTTYAVSPSRVRALLRPVVAGPGAAVHTHCTPLTGAPIATVPLSSAEDVAVAVASARAAQRAWARTSFVHRERIMLRFHDLVLARQAEILDAIQLESGKVRRHAYEEIADVALAARHYGRAAADYLQERKHAGVYPLLTRSVEHHRPKGVVGIVAPWNYPFSLALGDAIPALMAGNAVVLRPDQQSVLSALLGVELLAEAGLPEGVLQVVLGPGSSTGQAVVDQADYVCFTGSTATGRRVAQSAAGRLVSFSLELGGKNSLYVADDAALARAVEGAVRGCFASAGQLCVSAERVLVHDGIYDEFVPAFVEAVSALRLGVGLEWGPQMGSLVSADQLEVVTQHVEDARAHGAQVLTGGRARPDIGPFVYEPTVLTGVTGQMRCRNEETFGPVVAIYRVHSDDEAIALANDTEYGLNASVWTRDSRRGRRIAARIETGTVNVNEGYAAAWASMGSPMGGMKASGMGRRHGAEGILKYTESQNVTVQHLTGLGDLPGLTQRQSTALLTASLKLLKRLGAR